MGYCSNTGCISVGPELGPKLFEKVIITQQKLLLAKKELIRIHHVDKKNNMNPGHEVIKLEYSLKIKCNDWLLADMCRHPQAANHCTLF